MNSVAVSRLSFDDLAMTAVGADPRTVSVVMVVYMTGEALKRSLACVLASASDEKATVP